MDVNVKVVVVVSLPEIEAVLDVEVDEHDNVNANKRTVKNCIGDFSTASSKLQKAYLFHERNCSVWSNRYRIDGD